MKKIFSILVPILITCALIGFIFNLSEYDFFVQIAKIENMTFKNPLDEWNNITRAWDNFTLEYEKPNAFIWQYIDVNNISDFFTNVSIFFSGLGNGLKSLWNEITSFSLMIWEFLILPFQIAKDTIYDIAKGIEALMYLLGF